MKQNMEVSSGNKIYIDPDCFRKSKERLKKKGVKWSNEQLAEKIGVSTRMFQGYVNGKRHIPEHRLKDLAECLKDSPYYLTGRFREHMEPVRLRALEHGNKMLLSEYLINTGIVQGPAATENHIMVNDVELSEDLYEALIEETYSSLQYTIEHFCALVPLLTEGKKAEGGK